MRKKQRQIMAALLAVSMACMANGCAGGKGGDQSAVLTEAIEETKTEETDRNRLEDQEKGSQTESKETEEKETTKKEEQEVSKIEAKPLFYREEKGYKPESYEVNVPSYLVNEDLSNIVNMDQFPNLTKEQRDKIVQNGFVVIPTDSEQLFYIYEENTYKKIPSFVTVDSVLQLYHIFYDYSLRQLEIDFFYEDTIYLNQAMLDQLMEEYMKVENPVVKMSVQTMLGYFGVVNLIMEQSLPEGFPENIKALAEQEYDLIRNAAGKEISPLFQYKVDYSLFQVRGHYTRSEELGRYFQAVSWYGIIPFPLYGENGEQQEEWAMRAIVTAAALEKAPEDVKKTWENMYSTTSFFSGDADDITPLEIQAVCSQIWSENTEFDAFPEKIDVFYEKASQLRRQKIVQKTEDTVDVLQMRFMGQRYMPDSEILQNLTEPVKRPCPVGLDVFAVFGSDRAKELLDLFYKPQELWSGYQESFDKLAAEFQGQTVQEQTKNLYQGWLYCLKSLTGCVDEGYPFFMRNTAWEDKSLATALGSWAEMRHDTILYGKQSATECGGGEEPPELMGYVEPNPEFFSRLLWLTATTRESLGERGLLNEDMLFKYEQLESMLDFLKTCAKKELEGEDLSVEEHYTLLTYGGTLEYLSSSIADADGWYLVESETDKNMAVIADVHTAGASYLEEGVGTAAEIYVAIPQKGEVYLTRGAVFDYFEFVSDTRLTDEEWQAQIKEAAPERPPFVDSYMDDQNSLEIPIPENPYSTGC